MALIWQQGAMICSLKRIKLGVTQLFQETPSGYNLIVEEPLSYFTHIYRSAWSVRPLISVCAVFISRWSRSWRRQWLGSLCTRTAATLFHSAVSHREPVFIKPGKGSDIFQSYCLYYPGWRSSCLFISAQGEGSAVLFYTITSQSFWVDETKLCSHVARCRYEPTGDIFKAFAQVFNSYFLKTKCCWWYKMMNKRRERAEENLTSRM